MQNQMSWSDLIFRPTIHYTIFVNHLEAWINLFGVHIHGQLTRDAPTDTHLKRVTRRETFPNFFSILTLILIRFIHVHPKRITVEYISMNHPPASVNP